MNNLECSKNLKVFIYRVTPSGLESVELEDSEDYYVSKKNKIPAPHPCPCNGC